ncbi:MAG: right-handed parallel beta-helix repeat-containing protein, partial [Flavobacteriales bacterium]|nr:right-handed parallel beta-helix repeat-containing protein [Flavobacteriales bacterium]
MKTALRLKRFALTLSITCISLITFAVPLAGTYTIGGTTPDYTTFTLAVADLVLQGVSAPVVFNVRDGLYNEQISISNVAGTSGTNTVTFQSQSGDSSLAIIAYTPTSGANYTVRFNGCNNIIFNQLTISAVGATYAHAVEYTNSSTFTTLQNNSIEGNVTTSTGTTMAVIFENAGTNSNNTLLNNLIKDGSQGFYHTGVASGLVIQNNAFEAQRYQGIYVGFIDNVEIVGNTISSATASFGIRLEDCDNQIQIRDNQINLTGTGTLYGFYFNDCFGSGANIGVIANNFIHIAGSSTNYGMYLYDNTYRHFYYNSINMTGTSSASRAFYVAGVSSNLNVQNNIFAAPGGGYPQYIATTTAINVSNYNDMYTTGTYVGYWAGSRTTLSAWTSASLKDANSVSIDPEFVSNTDMHVQNYLIDNLGLAVAEVLNDIDGETRSVITPDMGGDEWSTPNDDAGVISIDQGLTYCIVNDSVYVTIKNFGTTNLTAVQVNWTVNSVGQTPYAWTGNLAQGATEGPFSVGFYDFNLGGQYDVSAWTSLPNGNPEGLTHNDQSDILNTYQAMSGNYTIGGVTPDYSTFSLAVTDLVNGGVCGPVVFNVRDGFYNEQISISNVTGTSGTNTVTFQSESSDSTLVILTFTPTSGANYTVRFNGCDYITFKQFSIRAVGATYAHAVEFNNSSTNNSLQNNLIDGNVTTSTSLAMVVVYENTGTNSNNTLINNLVTDGSYGFYHTGVASGLLLQNNSFIDNYYDG